MEKQFVPQFWFVSMKIDDTNNQKNTMPPETIELQGYESIPHSVGHGIGVEVHESPHLSLNSKDIIKQNMVFSVEPGIYIPNFGGVRIEDLVLVGKKGAELISHANREIIEV